MPTPQSKKLRVCDSDLKNLRESGLTDRTIRAAGLYTKNGGLHFPYRDSEGIVNGFTRWRLHTPLGSAKYLQGKGTKTRAYFPPASIDKLKDKSEPVYITEGEKKGLALSQLGLAVIGLSGVYGWKVKDKERLIDDLLNLHWTGRAVYVVFDYEPKKETRRNVDKARKRLAKLLREIGAKEVYHVELPEAWKMQPHVNELRELSIGDTCAEVLQNQRMRTKQGIDDFLVIHGPDKFFELVEKAEPVPEPFDCSTAQPSGRTDVANAIRLIEKFGHNLHYVGPWKKWLVWDGKRWTTDDDLQLHLMAKEIAAGLWDDVKAASGADDGQYKNILQFAAYSNTSSGICNLVNMARSEPGVPISVDALDNDPWILNVQNGTVDLRRGTLRAHDRDDLLTKICPVHFDAKASCPLWIKFLDRIFRANAELIRYVQQLAGYSLTGAVEDHVLLMLYGTGANGKSVLLETLMRLSGSDYAMKAMMELLMVRRGERHPTEKADLFGKRLVACTESEDGGKLSEASVKELTGGDRIRARWCKQDSFEFPATHKIWLATNYRPVITGTDNGIWRRVKLIPFEVTIPDEEQDTRLPLKLADELPGILNWAIAGCLDWQKSGLQEPKEVKAATDDYAQDMDVVGQFIDEYCERGDNLKEAKGELHRKFQDETGSKMSARTFSERLRGRGFMDKTPDGKEVRTSKAKKGWKGLRLKTTAEVQNLTKELNRKRKGQV